MLLLPELHERLSTPPNRRARDEFQHPNWHAQLIRVRSAILLSIEGQKQRVSSMVTAETICEEVNYN